MAEAAAEGKSLTSTFNKVNHAHHWFMMISMSLMAISMAVAAAGPGVALLDPVVHYGKMLFSGFTGIGDVVNFVPDAITNASNGTWLSGAEAAVDHAHHATETVTNTVTNTATEQTFNAAANPPAAPAATPSSPTPAVTPPVDHSHHMHGHTPPADDAICGGPMLKR